MSKNNKTLKQLRREQNKNVLTSKGFNYVTNHLQAHNLDFLLQLAMNKLIEYYAIKHNKHDMTIAKVLHSLQAQKTAVTRYARVKTQENIGEVTEERASCLYNGVPDQEHFTCPNCAHDIELLPAPKYPTKRK